jgi:thiamine pyrophosphate-dependent acetolactate synthase large subunit-like protein
MTSQFRSLSSAVAEVVRQRSEILFGLMGNGNAHLISSLTSSGFRYVGARHEAGTVAMADAYYRASRKIATATVTYGAGFTNALTSLAEARMARIPLVLIVGDAPSTGLRPWDVDQPMIAAGMGVTTVVLRAENVAADVVGAYETALRESVPVVVSIPYDLATAPVTEPVPSETLNTAGPGPAPGYRAQVDAQALEAVRRALTAAERPLIIAGRGVVEAAGSAQLWRDIGDRVGALFATSVMARNAFDSPWDLGVAGGFAQLPGAEVMGRADVVVAVGASLNTFQMRYGTLFGPEAKVIQIDIRENATHERVDLFVQADASAFSARLLEGLEERAENTAWRDQVPAPAGPRVGPEETGCCADGRLNPQPFAHVLEEILPKNRTIVQDGGHFSGWMPMYCSAPDPQGLMLVGTAFQTIGLGFPAAVGAAAARPERTTVLVTGDGGGLMALADMDTFIRTARSGLVVVFNDAAYGAELHQYAVRGLDATAMLIDEVDFAAVGRALGAHGLKARSLADLEVVRDWVQAGAEGVFVLDLPVSQSEVAPYMRESVELAMAQERQPIAAK